jgi:hypothetical protein
VKIIRVRSCSECPNYVQGPAHTPSSGGCKSSWIWFGTGVDTSIIQAGCRLEDAPACFGGRERAISKQTKRGVKPKS